jgi:hypothetical protein
LVLPTLSHFERAAREIAAHGDNDVLPFDVDTKFCGDKAAELAAIARGPTTPGHPFKVRIEINNNANLQIVGIRHERKSGDWTPVKVTDLNALPAPPSFFGPTVAK